MWTVVFFLIQSLPLILTSVVEYVDTFQKSSGNQSALTCVCALEACTEVKMPSPIRKKTFNSFSEPVPYLEESSMFKY